MEYRRRKTSDTWHFCRNCSNDAKGRPGIDYDVRYTKPTSGELSNECLAKQREKNCTS